MAVPEERTSEAVRQQIGSRSAAPPLPFTVAAAPNARRSTDWGSFWRAAVMGGGVALGAFVLISKVLPTVPRAHLGAAGKLALVVGVLAAAALAPFAHELGHVLGGALVRFRFTMLAWGPLRVSREGDRIRLALNRNIDFIGGIALSLPRTTDDLARRTAVVVAMGPFTSLMLGLTFLLLSYQTDIWRSPAAMADPVRAVSGIVAGTFGVASLGISLVTLMPGRSGGFATDGAQILRYLRGGPAVERHSALVALAGLSTTAMRPRDWPSSLIERLTTGDSMSSERTLADTFIYYKALDSGDFRRAHHALSASLERTAQTGRKARAPYAQEAAFFELVIRGDRPAAERWLAEELPGAVPDQVTRRVLLELVALTQALETGDELAAASARSGIESSLPSLAARSGTDALKAQMVARRVREL